MSWLSKFVKRAVRPVVQAVGDIALPAAAALFGGPKAAFATSTALDLARAVTQPAPTFQNVMPNVQRLIQAQPQSGFAQFSGGFGGMPQPRPGGAPWLPDEPIGTMPGAVVNVQCGMPCGCPTPAQMQPGGFQQAAFPLLPAIGIGAAGAAGAALSAIEAYLAARRLVRDVQGAVEDARRGDVLGLQQLQREREEAQRREREARTSIQRLISPPDERPMPQREVPRDDEPSGERQPAARSARPRVSRPLEDGTRRLLARPRAAPERQPAEDARRAPRAGSRAPRGQSGETRAAYCERVYGEGTDSYFVCMTGEEADGRQIPPGRGANSWPGLRRRQEREPDMSMFKYGEGMNSGGGRAGPGAGGRASRRSAIPRRGSRLPRAERARRRRATRAAAPRASRTRSPSPAQLRARRQFAAMARARARTR
jgi:hypothetical protein